MKRQAIIEITVGVIAKIPNALWIRELPVSLDLVAPAEFYRSHLCAAPGTAQHDKRILATSVQKLLEFLACIVVPDWRYIASDPKTNGNRRLTEIVSVGPAKLLARANQ